MCFDRQLIGDDVLAFIQSEWRTEVLHVVATQGGIINASIAGGHS